MTHNWNYKVNSAANFISKILDSHGFKPSIWIVLGSGFRECVRKWETKFEIPMAQIPGFPTPTVAGHGSQIIGANIKTASGVTSALIATGRVHLYEGFTPYQVCFPIFVAHQLSVKNIILTNAAGQISEDARVGSVTIVSDHINLTGQNIACVTPENRPARFVDMSDAYCRAWRERVNASLQLFEGTYAGMLGPTFETPAEAKMLKILGADLAGMSTVQETIAARMNQQNVFACSFVTNVAGGIEAKHEDVINIVRSKLDNIHQIIDTIIEHAPH